MGNPARVVVLAEDSRQQRFALRYLERLGYHSREVRRADLPSGRGSGEQFVRKQYAKEVLAHRQRAASTNVALVVLIDADDKTVADHHTELRKELTDLSRDPRGVAERIVHLIPKWSIET